MTIAAIYNNNRTKADLALSRCQIVNRGTGEIQRASAKRLIGDSFRSRI
ncbi:MAG: hypothetical protein LBI57_00035 [Helicobacteraceae bacterium]|nr:hypothetical protein [Helicobacteraceae bacterium]